VRRAVPAVVDRHTEPVAHQCLLSGRRQGVVNAYYLTAERLGVVVAYDSEVLALKLQTVRCVRWTHYRGYPYTVQSALRDCIVGRFQANLDWMRQYWVTRWTILSSAHAV